MYMYRKIGVVLVDSGCSRTIVSRKMCQTWKKKDLKVMNFSEEMYISGVRQIDLQVDRGSAEIEALVAQVDPLGFNILIGMDG